jgi:fructose-specific phosphotransferase system IIC component
MENVFDFLFVLIIPIIAILIYFLVMIYIFTKLFEKEIYNQALKIFYEWKREIYGSGSGVALK